MGQLAKKKWLKEGDDNSKFFHVVVNKHRHHSLIDSMQLVDGTVLVALEEVYEGAVHYFQQFFFDHCNRDFLDLSHLILKVITEEENGHIVACPSKIELKEAR